MTDEQIAALMREYALLYLAAMYGKRPVPNAMDVLKGVKK